MVNVGIHAVKILQLLTKTLLCNKRGPFTTFANKAEKDRRWCAVALSEFTVISISNPLTPV